MKKENTLNTLNTLTVKCRSIGKEVTLMVMLVIRMVIEILCHKYKRQQRQPSALSLRFKVSKGFEIRIS